jgi:hypothetical protein
MKNFSVLGKLAVTYSFLGTIAIFLLPLTAGAQTQDVVWQATATGGNAIAFSADGNRVLAGNQLRNASDGGLIETFRPRRTGIISVALSPDNQYAAIGTSTNVLNLNFFKVADGSRTTLGDAHNNGTSTLKFSDDSQLLASGGRDGSVKLWHVPDLTLLKTFLDVPGYSARVSSLAFSKDQQYLAVGSQSGAVIIRIADGSIVRVLADRGSVASVAFSPDGGTVAGAFFTAPYALQFWDFNTGVLLKSIEASDQPLTSTAYQPDGEVIAVGGGDNTYSGIIRFFRVSDSQLLGFFPQDPNNTSSYISGIAYSPDGQLIGYVRADQLAVVARNPFTCLTRLSVTDESVAAKGGNGFIDVTTCSDWKAESDSDWIILWKGEGEGSGTVEYFVERNSGKERTGNITINGQSVTITQRGSFSDPPRRWLEVKRRELTERSNSSDLRKLEE